MFEFYMGMLIRKAREEDLESLERLYITAVSELRKIEHKKKIILFPAGFLRELVHEFWVAVYDDEIIGEMALSYPHRIEYVNMSGKTEVTEDAFFHLEYSLQLHRRKDPLSRILPEIEKFARGNQEIRYLYAAAEFLRPEWWEGMGYGKVGIECRSCNQWGLRCRDVPMYRKKNE